MTNTSHRITVLTLLTIVATASVPALAEETYNARCLAAGDSISLTGTGEIVLEQRLVTFKLVEPDKGMGSKGICVIKKDPPGFKWIECQKENGMYVTGNYQYPTRPTRIKPVQAVANSVLYRGWSGACKVKL